MRFLTQAMRLTLSSPRIPSLPAIAGSAFACHTTHSDERFHRRRLLTELMDRPIVTTPKTASDAVQNLASPPGLPKSPDLGAPVRRFGDGREWRIPPIVESVLSSSSRGREALRGT